MALSNQAACRDKDRPDPIRILFIEDDPNWQERLLYVLSQGSNDFLITVAGNLADGLARIGDTTFDIGIFDLGLPDGTGVDAVKAARKNVPNSEILIHTIFDDPEHIMSAISAGATGYILKTASATEWNDVLKDLMAGHSPISPKIARHVLRQLQLRASTGKAPSPKRGATPAPTSHGLTEREVEVLRVVSKGFSHTEAARVLSISPETVRSHIKRIYQQLEVNSRTEALYEAMQIGLI